MIASTTLRVREATAADGAPVHLETSDPRNVTLYRRLGLEVAAAVEPSGDAPPVWLMRRDPR